MDMPEREKGARHRNGVSAIFFFLRHISERIITFRKDNLYA